MKPRLMTKEEVLAALWKAVGANTSALNALKANDPAREVMGLIVTKVMCNIDSIRSLAVEPGKLASVIYEGYRQHKETFVGIFEGFTDSDKDSGHFVRAAFRTVAASDKTVNSESVGDEWTFYGSLCYVEPFTDSPATLVGLEIKGKAWEEVFKGE